jgi:hypothetical protein
MAKLEIELRGLVCLGSGIATKASALRSVLTSATERNDILECWRPRRGHPELNCCLTTQGTGESFSNKGFHFVCTYFG